MSENKYGHLLDKYMDGDNKKDYNGILHKAEKKYKGTENSRYGNLLDNAKPDYKLYDDIINVSDTCRAARQHKEEEERQIQAKRQERIEREKREMDERIDRNNAFVNSYLEKKQAEQEAVRKAREEKRREEAEQQKLYNSIDRLMNISPKLADAFVEARTHTWK